MRSLRLVLVAVAALVLSLGLVACGDDDDGEGATTEEVTIPGGVTNLDLTIGDLVPLTGDLSDFGPPGQKAADMAIDEINEAIEQAGGDHSVQIVHEDDQTDPQAGVSAARKLVGDGASCIAGSWASSVSIPVAESVSLREGVLQISPASTSDEITGLDDPDNLMNRTVPPDALQGPTLAEYMEEQLGGAEETVINVGARNDAYGEGLADTFSAAWEAKGGQIGSEVIYDPDLPNYNSEAQQLTSGDPDGYVIVDFPETFLKVGPALERTGAWDRESTFVTDGLASGDLAPEGFAQGLRGTAPGAPDEGRPSEAFDELYAESEPTDVDRMTFDAQNFDAVVLCYLAAVGAGSTDGSAMANVVRAISAAPGTKYTWEQLPEAVEALQNGEDIDYEGASGSIEMDDVGDATAGVYDIFEYTDGELEINDEVPVETKADEE